MDESKRTGLNKLIENLRNFLNTFVGSYLRYGMPTSERTRSAVIVNNFFLHLHSVKTHQNTLRPTYTFGLGLISLFLLVICTVSGIFLMIYYQPSIEHAYESVKDINFVVFTGRLLRNVHKWSGEGMIISVMLHMARVLYTGSYKQGREFNWVIGILLLIFTFALNFTGYLLPWDQLAYWALVIGSNIAQSPKEITDILGITRFIDIGALQKELLLGGTIPGTSTIIRVYFLHIMLLPICLFIFLAVHFWRIRKDGGLSVPETFQPTEKEGSSLLPAERKGGEKTYDLMALPRGKPAADRDIGNTVLSWPHLLRAEVAVFMLCLTAVIIYSFYIDAPLREPANALIPENPAKAPWYFLGLQELVSYSAFMGGIALPSLALLAIGVIPYLDREQQYVGIWFSNRQGRLVTVLSFFIGTGILIGLLVVVVNFGWFRNWWPDIPQLIIIMINPGTIWVGIVLLWSLLVTHMTGSTRMGAIAVFTMFLISFVILTYMGTELRGPNWDFYWSKSQWPVH